MAEVPSGFEDIGKVELSAGLESVVSSDLNNQSRVDQIWRELTRTNPGLALFLLKEVRELSSRGEEAAALRGLTALFDVKRLTGTEPARHADDFLRHISGEPEIPPAA